MLVVSSPATQSICPRCHTPAELPARFCGSCGADLRSASPLKMAAAREGVADEEVEKVESSWSSARARADSTASGVDRRITASNNAWMGKIVDSRYRVTDLIGRGGMGVVYKVEHLRMGKVAAMKVLHADLAEDADVIRRFESEANLVSRLNHPNTVQVFDFGQAQGALYLIMEYVRGLDLGAIIQRDGPLPWSRAAPLFHQISGALAEAHDLGIVHRDLKPENVLVTRSTGGRDFAKVLDFGLAKLAVRELVPAAPAVTDRTEIVGTPYFMSPEQIRGDEVDARSDLYSMGALMYNVLTGTHVFTAKNAVGVLTKHLTADVEVPSVRAPELHLDDRVDEIVLKALAKEPAARWPSAAVLGEAIERTYNDLVGDLPMGSTSRRLARRDTSSVHDEPVSDFRLKRADLDEFERSLRRRKVWVALAGVTMFLAAAAAVGWYGFMRTAPPSSREREPDDELGDATRIAMDSQVTGMLGQRLGPHDPDHDIYRVAGTDDDRERVISVHVSGLPNIDENLSLLDGAGHVVAVINEGGVGSGEAFHRRRIRGPVIVQIGEVMPGGQEWPVENVSDPYTLTVAIDDKPGWEIEPDGTPIDAVTIKVGEPMRGWLDARADIDELRFEGAAGRYVVDVAAEAALPFSWRVGDTAAGLGAGKVDVELKPGDVIRLARTDGDRGEGQPLPGEEDPWTVTVTLARAP